MRQWRGTSRRDGAGGPSAPGPCATREAAAWSDAPWLEERSGGEHEHVKLAATRLSMEELEAKACIGQTWRAGVSERSFLR